MSTYVPSPLFVVIDDIILTHKNKRPSGFLDGLLHSHASIAVAFSDLIIMNMLIAGTQGP